MHLPPTPVTIPRKKPSLGLWMHRVLEECERAARDFAPDPVHDLRVALRRCRSLADGFIAMDPDPTWRAMKKAGREVFRSLGTLRDVQVMEEWVRRLADPQDPVAVALLMYFTTQESEFKRAAAVTLSKFDQRQWRKWSFELPRRAAKLNPGRQLFLHLALERWTEAHDLHRQALRNRSKVALHNLRIGIKRFRYVVENFLPALHEAWSGDLKELQDLLGEVHDLDVLWGTALQIHAFSNAEDRLAWEKKIGKEREQRLSRYREKMMGEGSLWQVWRGALPEGAKIETAALSRLKLWASHLDPDIRHSEHVTKLALELFDGLDAPGGQRERERSVLKLAALMHDVGRSKGEKGHHKASYRLLSKMKAPLGCQPADMSLAALVARYHQGGVPRVGHPGWTGLEHEQRKTILQLAGILRLANAFDAGHDGHIKRLEIAVSNSAIQVFAEGYSPRSPLAEQIAAARHLLEITYRRPVMIKTLRAAQSLTRGRSATAAAGS